jgi:hypothetical protein
MSLTDRSLVSQAFKLSQRRAHTATNRNFYNESEESSYVVYAKDIWANIVDPDPSVAVANGDVALVKLRMKSIFVAGQTNASAYSAVFYWEDQTVLTKSLLTGKINPRTGTLFSTTSGETVGNGNGLRVGHIIPSIINKQPVTSTGYNPVLKNRSGVIVPPGDASDWYLDTFAGIVTHEIDSPSDFMLLNGAGNTYDEEGTLDCYIYIGNFLTDVLDISGGSGSVPSSVTDAIALLQTQVGDLDTRVETISGDLNALELQVDSFTTSVTSISSDVTTLQDQYNTLASNVDNISGSLSNYAGLGEDNTFTGATNVFLGDVTVQGTFTAAGSAFFVNAQNTSVTGALLTLNEGEVGAGVTQGEAGIIIDRGSAPDGDYKIVYEEARGSLVIGLSGDTDIVATRTTYPVIDGALVIGDSDGKNFKQDSAVAWDGQSLNIDGGLSLTVSGSGANDVVTRSEVESMISTLGTGDVTQSELVSVSAGLNTRIESLETQFTELVGASGNVIGPPVDTYEDGLFTEFTNTTPIGHAIDKINEILKAIAPASPPVFSEMSIGRTGVAGRLSFGDDNAIAGYSDYTIANSASSDKDVNDSVTLSSRVKGIITKTGVVNGTLNDQAPADSAWNDSGDVFADGNKGQLELWINGSEKVSARLDLTNESLSGDQRDVNGTGFYGILEATPITLEGSGGVSVPLDAIKYRRADWQVSVPHDFRNGLNTVQVIHRINSTIRESTKYEFVVDASTDTVVYSGESLGTFSPGSTKTLSGVTYYTSGTINYSITIDGAYKNTFVDSSGSIILSGTNVAQANVTFPTIGTGEDETKDIEIVNKSVGISLGGNRLLGQTVTIQTQVPRTVQTVVSSTGVTSTNSYLMDNVTANSTDLIEYFNDERYRMDQVSDLDDTSYSSGGGVGGSPDVWDTATSLVTYNDGLLIYSGKLTYPSRTNYNSSAITNGNFATANLLPAGNPNYSTLANTGNKVYIRYFYVGSNIQNFRMKIDTDGSTVFVPVPESLSSLTSNQMTVEILAPNTTKKFVETSPSVFEEQTEWKDAYISWNGNDYDIGCFNDGLSSGEYRGYTLGESDTSTSGNVIVVRLRVSEDWNDRVTQIEVQPLTS